MPAFVQGVYLAPDGGPKMELVEAFAAIHPAHLVETSASLRPTECTHTVSLTRTGAANRWPNGVERVSEMASTPIQIRIAERFSTTGVVTPAYSPPPRLKTTASYSLPRLARL